VVGSVDITTPTTVHHRMAPPRERSLVSQQCRLAYDIKPFKDEVLCDVAPLEVCDVILGQPYLWKCHVVYESRPRSVIITLDRKLYRIPEVVPPTAISLISTKQCRKVISQTEKFVFFMIHAQSEWKVATTSMASMIGLSMQQSKWIRSWKNTKTSSPHPLGYLCTVRSSTQSI
jgi:hypothetical protein